MKTTLVAATIALSTFSAAAMAECYGTDAYQSCYDSQSGNSYDIQRFGNQTYMRGRNSRTGSTWSQDSTTYGSTTFHHGRDSNGSTWNSTTQRGYGGYDSDYGSGIGGRGMSNCGIAGCD